MSAKNIEVKILDNAELIEEVCALLYKTHIEQAHWQFEPDNPSKLRIEWRHHRNLLIDRFTDKAVWFGAFDGQQLVGCTRLTFADGNNQLEVESYQNSSVIQKYLPNDRSHCAESTRTGILKSYNGSGILRLLLLSAFQYCEDNQYSLCASVDNKNIVGFLKKIGYPLKMENAFKYEELDPNPVNFYFADYEISEIKNMILKLESHEDKKDTGSSKIFSALEIVAPIMPIPVYWHDIRGVVLGLNSHCLKGMGATKESDIIGKTPYDFYPRNIAEHILNHHDQVIKTGEISSQDEQIEDISTGSIKIFRNIKAPLYGDDGKIIGILGTAIEVTAEKEAERLRIENEKQKMLLSEEEKFRKLAHKVAHDIRSPLATLSIIVGGCTQIPESERIALREAARSIADIANHLLHQYQKKEIEVKNEKGSQDILVSTALMELLTSKKYQYKSAPIQFDYHFEANATFACIDIAESAFKRTISNLMNNAVDALVGTTGEVSLQLEADNEWVRISIKDTGKGMPQELIDKIMNKTAFTSGKTSGHGIGLTQVWETLEHHQGEMHIDSKPGFGATITLKFPRVKMPNWMTDEIVLNTDDIVIILDDDVSIHSAWCLRFEAILNQHPEMTLKHFEEGEKALQFIQSLLTEEKSRVFLLNDYELLEQELNGLHVIEQSRISRSILVTSHYGDVCIQERAIKTGVRILPKPLASEVRIMVSQT